MKPQELYAQLELIAPEQLAAAPGPAAAMRRLDQAKAALADVGHSLLAYFCGSQEPKVACRRDRTGHAYYTVYDPFDQQHHRFDSEAALRIWLERRYYQ